MELIKGRFHWALLNMVMGFLKNSELLAKQP
jgi:hypothetical protein